MRLAIVNYVWDPQEATPATLLDRHPSLTGWAEALRAAGWDPVVVCQRFVSRSDFVRDGVTYRFRPDSGRPHPGVTFRGADAVHASAAAARPDVVHVNRLLHPALVRRLRARLPKRSALVVQDHGGADPRRLTVPRRTAIRRGLAAADALFVSSRGRGTAWRESGAVPRALEIGDVMETSTSLAPVARHEARFVSGVEGSPALLWVGRLDAANDPLTVLRGFALFAGRIPTSRLTMVYADAALLHEARLEIARTPVLESRVRLVGPVPHSALAAYYSAADFLVLGRRTEGETGDAVLEAMACGAIPVVSDVPSFRALTGSERVGALWKPGQPQAFADALARALARPLASEREATRARFEKDFSWPAVAWRADQLYRQAIARRRASRS